MAHTLLHELAEAGQSAWLDNISKKVLGDGTLENFIGQGLLGLTSNPSIFDNAISKTSDYDADIREMAEKGATEFDIYDELTVRDIRAAADLLMPVYESSNKKDGYVSLEINPKLAKNLEETIAEGKRLHKKVGRPNLMLKVPATDEGLAAVEEFIASGVNVNVTLIFSADRYRKTAQAYKKGVRRLEAEGKDTAGVHSVASIFISRIDTAVDKAVKKEELAGTAATANAAKIYRIYHEEFDGFGSGNFQRPLWASTSTKNPQYRDVKYVEDLIYPDTVNTIPEATLKAFIEHGRIGKPRYTAQQAEEILKELEAEGIDMDALCETLLSEGLDAFEKAFDSLMNNIGEKSRKLR